MYSDVTQTNDEKLGTPRLLKMAQGVASGMDYLSTIGFVHRVSMQPYITILCTSVPPIVNGHALLCDVYCSNALPSTLYIVIVGFGSS